jgi:GxxExxY protein
MEKKYKAEQSYDSLAKMAHLVFSELSAGFIENIYHKAYIHELQLAGISHETEKVIPIFYREVQVGYVRCDLLVENNVLIEMKTVQKVLPQHLLQLERYGTHLNINKLMLVNYPIQKDKQVEIYVYMDGGFVKLDS